jgi:hypothetical protein
MKMSVLMSPLSFQGLTVWSLLAQLWPGEGAPSLFPVPKERGQGLPQPQPGKWHRPSVSPVEFRYADPPKVGFNRAGHSEETSAKAKRGSCETTNI